MDGPAVPAPLRVLRLLRLAAVVLLAGLALPFVGLARPAGRRRALGWFARQVLRALGVRVHARGAVRQRRALLVANHVSWLDIVVLLAGARPLSGVRLVAKVEVRGWPVVGRFAALVGTIFIDRSRPRLLPATVEQVREALAAGDQVAVFPEGTTSCGRATGPFRPAMFEAAIGAGAAVVPVRLRYRLPDGRTTTAPAFVGDETLLDSLRRILPLRGLCVEVSTCPALHPEARAERRAARSARRALAHLAGAAISAQPPAPLPRPDAVPAPATGALPGGVLTQAR